MRQEDAFSTMAGTQPAVVGWVVVLAIGPLWQLPKLNTVQCCGCWEAVQVKQVWVFVAGLCLWWVTSEWVMMMMRFLAQYHMASCFLQVHCVS